ncbi:hypothetical protein BDQ12DRAFT_362892 [Crucibulum laeve]|uniref:Uncharacterized protein n=1 Tax=Crucibulum laeve TaxID=68775 RepID=A0A5C3LPK4_9AGAR|nr:hypothetical protein BDQ12DRAFT_362892 [Crucibulum laeve]
MVSTSEESKFSTPEILLRFNRISRVWDMFSSKHITGFRTYRTLVSTVLGISCAGYSSLIQKI